MDDPFLAAVERLGGGRAAASKALTLSQIATHVSLRLIEADLVGSQADGEQQSLSRFDIHELLYDIETPLELRKAAQADFESAICMIALAYAVAASEAPPEWLVAELVERWLAGQLSSLPLIAAIALDRGVRLDDALPEHLVIKVDELHQKEGFDLFAQAGKGARNLAAGQERAETMTSQLHAIAKHANRQSDGVWPKK